MALPSLRNSGLETTSKFASLLYFLIIFFNSEEVPTGTVDFVIITQYLFNKGAISFAAE